MKAFTTLEGLVLPLDRSDVDTDQIIPKQYLKSIRRTGFSDYLFDSLRFLDEGTLDKTLQQRTPNPDFVLNQERYQGASILLGRRNFGCGSSREHAVWALDEWGIRCILAPSFADIFRDNAGKNGLLTATLPEEKIDALFRLVEDTPSSSPSPSPSPNPSPNPSPGLRLHIDLAREELRLPSGEAWPFAVLPVQKQRLLEGLDNIAITLQDAAAIRSFEERHRQRFPWLLDSAGAP